MSRPIAQAQAAPTRAPSAFRSRPLAHSLRRFAGRLAALLADDGMSDRFAAERRRDEGLLRRVEGPQRRP